MVALRDQDCEASMDKLVVAYQHELVGFFYARIFQQDVAEDLAQQVFIKVYRARQRWEPRASVRTFLYRIAHNALIDHLRRRRPSVSLEADEHVLLRDRLADPSQKHDPVHSEELRDRITAALEDLSDLHREVFILGQIQELPYSEISEILDIPEGTVKSRMYTAMRRLRIALGDLESLL